MNHFNSYSYFFFGSYMYMYTLYIYIYTHYKYIYIYTYIHIYMYVCIRISCDGLDYVPLKNSYWIPNPSKSVNILGDKVVTEVKRLKYEITLNWALPQYGWCPCSKRKFGHRQPHEREQSVSRGKQSGADSSLTVLRGNQSAKTLWKN